MNKQTHVAEIITSSKLWRR